MFNPRGDGSSAACGLDPLSYGEASKPERAEHRCSPRSGRANHEPETLGAPLSCGDTHRFFSDSTSHMRTIDRRTILKTAAALSATSLAPGCVSPRSASDARVSRDSRLPARGEFVIRGATVL